MASAKFIESPQVFARTGGVLYLIIIVAGMFAEAFVRSRLVVSGDAAATANNIAGSQLLWRIGFSVELFALVCDVGVTLILYVLLRPVNEPLAMLAAFFRLAFVAIQGINELNHFAALFFVGGAGYLAAFSPEQLHALTLLSLKAHAFGYDICLVFFGFHLLIVGYLFFVSRYFPKFLGVLLVVAALCYLTNSFVSFLAPGFAAQLFPAILLPPFIAELSLCLWLIVKGVDVAQWR